MSSTNVEICGVKLGNSVIAASGTFGFGREYAEYFSISRLGGISSKGLTLNRRDGNKGVRVYETSSGLLNSIGLQNPGIEEFIEDELYFMKKHDTVILANVGASTIDEYIEIIEKLNKTNVDMVELNISCPNVKEGGMAFGVKSKIAYEVVSQVKSLCEKPLIVKLSPNAEDIVEMAESCAKAGADGLSLVNTFSGMAIDILARKPVFDNVIAGLSGPCIKPIALRMVYEVSGAVDIPIIGLGGIINYKDAIEFIMAGAHCVQVGTANFIKPDISIDIVEGIEGFLKDEGIKSIEEIRGIIRRDGLC